MRKLEESSMEEDGVVEFIKPAPRRSRSYTLSPWRLYQAIRHAKVLTVEPVVFLHMFGMYLSLPLFQQYYLNRYSLDALENTSYPYFNKSHCINKSEVEFYTSAEYIEHHNHSVYATEVLNNSTLLYVCRSLAAQVLSIFVTLILGPLSDRYGRKLVIVYVSIGEVLQGLLGVAIVYFDLDLHWFILCGAVEGLFGGASAILMAAFSYAADISSGKWRTVRIGLAKSMLYLAGIVARGLGELWFQKLNCDILFPLCLFVASNFAIIVYTLLFLPESLTSEERKEKNANKPKGLQQLARGASIFLCRVKKYSVWMLWLGLIPHVVMTMIFNAENSIGVFYFRAFNWTPKLIGINQATAMASHMISLMVILPILVQLKFPDPLISLIGATVNCVFNLLIGLAKHHYQLFIIGVVQGLDALEGPPLRGYMSKLVNQEDQGALFSIVAALESFGSLLSYAYTYVLPTLIEHHLGPGPAFFILSALGLIPTLFISIILVLWCREKCSTDGGGLSWEVHEDTMEKTPMLADVDEPEGTDDASVDSSESLNSLPPNYSLVKDKGSINS